MPLHAACATVYETENGIKALKICIVRYVQKVKMERNIDIIILRQVIDLYGTELPYH